MVTEITNISWLSRIGSSIKGVLFGVVLFLASFVVLWWNEGRAVNESQRIERFAAAVSVDTQAVDAANQSKLVHLSGNVTVDGELRDEVLGFSRKGVLKLSRKCEIYQWTESVETKSKKKVGGGSTEEKTYNYAQAWVDEPVNSGSFNAPQGHENTGSLPFKSGQSIVSQAKLGAFSVQGELLTKIDNFVPVDLTAEETQAIKAKLTATLPATQPSDLAKFGAGEVYLGVNPATPKVGDVRVTLTEVRPGAVSIIAMQQGPALAGFSTPNGTICELELGTKSVTEMMSSAQSRNALFTWILRLVGFVAMAIGIGLVFRPLTVVADVVPIFGDILSAGAGLLSIAIALPLSLLTIAIAWVFYRPVLGIGLLAGALAIFVALFLLARKRKKATA